MRAVWIKNLLWCLRHRSIHWNRWFASFPSDKFWLHALQLVHVVQALHHWREKQKNIQQTKVNYSAPKHTHRSPFLCDFLSTFCKRWLSANIRIHRQFRLSSFFDICVSKYPVQQLLAQLNFHQKAFVLFLLECQMTFHFSVLLKNNRSFCNYNFAQIRNVLCIYHEGLLWSDTKCCMMSEQAKCRTSFSLKTQCCQTRNL